MLWVARMVSLVSTLWKGIKNEGCWWGRSGSPIRVLVIQARLKRQMLSRFLT